MDRVTDNDGMIAAGMDLGQAAFDERNDILKNRRACVTDTIRDAVETTVLRLREVNRQVVLMFIQNMNAEHLAR